MNKTLLERFRKADSEPGSSAPSDSPHYREALWEMVRHLDERNIELEKRLAIAESQLQRLENQLQKQSARKGK